MKNMELLSTFAKGNVNSRIRSNKNAIIYTRVSSKEQMENMSLETQLKACKLYAEKNEYNLCGFFGGTYESAQTDERKEFVRMVNFSKNSKDKVSFIIVYSLERFSRTGDNAIWLSRQLRELGITIQSVTQPIDTTNPSGVLQQNILFLFSQYDNDLRREKSVAGMREKLLKGEWIGVPPIGYSYDRTGSKKDGQKIIINEKGDLVKQAFLMKVKEKLSNADILVRLQKLGLKIPKQTLSDLLRNPFYCGFVSHSFLNGELVKGKHPAIVSEKLFLEANEILSKNKSGFKLKENDDSLPLKRFVICGDCQTPFTGYLVKKKNLFYYKCNRVGCKCNKGAVVLHEKFLNLLSQYQIDKELLPILKQQLEYTYEHLTSNQVEEKKLLKQKYADLNEKLDKVEERYGLGEIDRGIYDKVSAKLKNEINPLKEEIEKGEKKLSNPSKLIEKALSLSCNLQELWKLGDFRRKQELQRLVFPDGIQYDRILDNYRTEKVNVVFEISKRFLDSYKNKKTGLINDFDDKSGLVPRAGLVTLDSVNIVK